MEGFEPTVWTEVRGYHIYNDSWAPLVKEEFVCYRECTNEHERHAVKMETQMTYLGTFQKNFQELPSLPFRALSEASTSNRYREDEYFVVAFTSR